MNNPTQLKHKKMTLKVQYEMLEDMSKSLQKFRKRQIKNLKKLTNPLKKNNRQDKQGNYARSENLSRNNKENTNGRNPGTSNNILECISAKDVK